MVDGGNSVGRRASVVDFVNRDQGVANVKPQQSPRLIGRRPLAGSWQAAPSRAAAANTGPIIGFQNKFPPMRRVGPLMRVFIKKGRAQDRIIPAAPLPSQRRDLWSEADCDTARTASAPRISSDAYFRPTCHAGRRKVWQLPFEPPVSWASINHSQVGLGRNPARGCRGRH